MLWCGMSLLISSRGMPQNAKQGAFQRGYSVSVLSTWPEGRPWTRIRAKVSGGTFWEARYLTDNPIPLDPMTSGCYSRRSSMGRAGVGGKSEYQTAKSTCCGLNRLELRLGGISL